MAKRTRSPNYPVINLEDAIARTESLYQNEHTHAAEREVIAHAIGYNSLNGASATVISAMAKYGLIEPADKGFRVSELALDILPLTREEDKYEEAIQKAAFEPSLFRELREEFGDQLPSDQNLRAKLIKRGFNPKRVDVVIHAYRETLEFLNREIQVRVGTVTADSHASPSQSNVEIPQPRRARHEMYRKEGHDASRHNDDRVYVFQLSEYCEARLILNGKVTREALDNLVEFVNLTKHAFPASHERFDEPSRDASSSSGLAEPRGACDL